MRNKIIFPICNKRPERAPKIFGHVFFLCWRCTGIVLGAGCMLFLIGQVSLVLCPELFVLSIACMLPLICDGIMQYGYTLVSNNFRRFTTGLLFGIGLVYAIGFTISDFDSIESHSVLVSSFVSIVGFFATFFSIRLELRKSLKERLADQQRLIYANCYRRIFELGRNPALIFEKSYYDSFVECTSELSLSASNEVILAFAELEKIVTVGYEKYKDFIDENDPFNNRENFERIYQGEGEEYMELYRGTEMDYKIYESRIARYVRENSPSKDIIETMLKNILNAMREDIGNSSIR